jgi:hypothetical protein
LSAATVASIYVVIASVRVVGCVEQTEIAVTFASIASIASSLASGISLAIIFLLKLFYC